MAAEALRRAIRRRFLDEERGGLRYLVDAGDPDPERREGLGYAFALLAGVLTPEETARMVASAPQTPQGIACVWPAYERYRMAPDAYGRHSGTVWPQVNAAWCGALALRGYGAEAWNELRLLAGKASRDLEFREIYHPESGLPYGGLQECAAAGKIIEWQSCRRQSWCASGFIHMVLTLLCGLRAAPEGIVFEPWLPPELEEITLLGLPYRAARLNLRIRRGTAAVPGLVLADAAGNLELELGV